MTHSSQGDCRCPATPSEARLSRISRESGTPGPECPTTGDDEPSDTARVRRSRPEEFPRPALRPAAVRQADVTAPGVALEELDLVRAQPVQRPGRCFRFRVSFG